jgi:hypothetical protein
MRVGKLTQGRRRRWPSRRRRMTSQPPRRAAAARPPPPSSPHARGRGKEAPTNPSSRTSRGRRLQPHTPAEAERGTGQTSKKMTASLSAPAAGAPGLLRAEPAGPRRPNASPRRQRAGGHQPDPHPASPAGAGPSVSAGASRGERGRDVEREEADGSGELAREPASGLGFGEEWICCRLRCCYCYCFCCLLCC